MSTLRRYFALTAAGLLLGWSSYPAAAEEPLGCDGISGLPRVDYLATPRNLGLFKQQLLIYRCTRYDSEIGLIVQEARTWLKQRAPQVSNPTVVLDIDETSLSNWTRIYQDEFFPFPSACNFTQKCSDRDWQWSEQAPATEAVLDLYKLAQCLDVAASCSKVDVYFVTGRREGDKYVPKEVCDPSRDKCDPSLLKSPRDWTLGNLLKAGFMGVTPDHVYLRPRDSSGPVSTYKTAKRIEIENLGKTIIANIGDQQSDLVGLHAERTFKLPNPFYFIP